MALLKENDCEQLREHFASLPNPVKLLVFTQADDCQFCDETVALATEVSELSDQISVESHDFVADSEIAEQFNIDKVPATVVLRDGDEPVDYGMRYYGIPSGYEFGSLIESIMLASTGESNLSAETIAWAEALKSPVHLQVFVTPTCPYCPRAVVLAQRVAMLSEFISADMVEATEFPELSQRYQVMGVPRTVINDDWHVEGAVPEPALLSRLVDATQVFA